VKRSRRELEKVHVSGNLGELSLDNEMQEFFVSVRGKIIVPRRRCDREKAML
jgi:hypothetical protein